MTTPKAIDITDLVEKTRSSFVDWAVLYVYGIEVAIPGMEWVGLPIVKDIDQEVLRLIIDGLSKSLVMGAFFMNTVMKKATDADDFIAAVAAIQNLPKDVSDEDFKKYRLAQMDAFRNFVALT